MAVYVSRLLMQLRRALRCVRHHFLICVDENRIIIDVYIYSLIHSLWNIKKKWIVVFSLHLTYIFTKELHILEHFENDIFSPKTYNVAHFFF